MNEEIKFLREHIKDICSYKGLQEELTYDISVDILKRICIAFDYLQQENKKLKMMVNFGGITIVNCPECNKEINVNFCRETEEYRKKYLNAVADYEYEKSKNQRAIDLLFEEYESCDGALSNPEHTIVSKHTLLKNEKYAIKKIIDLLKRK
jgi:hypothetical protein